MKNSFLVLLLLFGLSIQLFAQSKGFEGSWSGTLDAAGTKLRIVLSVTKSDAGTYTGNFESLDQGATIPLDSITVNGDNVRVEVKDAGIVYEGVMNKERTELTGKFSQGGQMFPLNFTRGESAAATPTPTPAPKPTAAPTPKPDYSAPADAPYTAEDVIVPTPGGFTLAGTLTLPKGASRSKPVAAIVTVTGSGPEDRDENIGLPGYRPFRQIADALGRHGIAVLRMDDRGTGASGGTFKGSTSADNVRKEPVKVEYQNDTIQKAASDLCLEISRFTTSPLFKPGVVYNLRYATEADNALDAVINISSNIKTSAEKLRKSH